jgi:hypothetical protein
LKVDPEFIPYDDTSEIVDLKFVELPEKFPRNLDPFHFLAGHEDIKIEWTDFSSGLE